MSIKRLILVAGLALALVAVAASPASAAVYTRSGSCINVLSNSRHTADVSYDSGPNVVRVVRAKATTRTLTGSLTNANVTARVYSNGVKQYEKSATNVAGITFSFSTPWYPLSSNNYVQMVFTKSGRTCSFNVAD